MVFLLVSQLLLFPLQSFLHTTPRVTVYNSHQNLSHLELNPNCLIQLQWPGPSWSPLQPLLLPYSLSHCPPAILAFFPFPELATLPRPPPPPRAFAHGFIQTETSSPSSHGPPVSHGQSQLQCPCHLREIFPDHLLFRIIAHTLLASFTEVFSIHTDLWLISFTIYCLSLHYTVSSWRQGSSPAPSMVPDTQQVWSVYLAWAH